MKDELPDVVTKFAVAAECDGFWVVNTIYGISVLTSYDPHDEDGKIKNDLPPVSTREKRRLIRKVNPDYVMDVKFHEYVTLASPSGSYGKPGYCEITGIRNGTVRTWRIKKGQSYASKRLVPSAPSLESSEFSEFLSYVIEHASDDIAYENPFISYGA